MSTLFRLWLLLLALLAPAARAQAPAGGEYRVGPGDTLKVQVWGEAELSRSYPVNEQGLLDFPLLGPVAVAGQTAVEVSGALTGMLRQGFLRDPQVTVWVEAFGSQPVQVLGAVARPGQVHVRGPTTLLELLGQVGGVSREGVDEIRLTRGGESGEVQVFSFQALRAAGEGGPLVQGGDVVFVPESQVHVLGQVVRPGPVAWREGLTVSRALAAAGGPAAAARLGRAWILREGERIPVNLRRVLRGQDEDPPLRGGDRIFLGESVL